jgi:hypothetical protein
MTGLLCFVLAVLASPIKSKMRLEAEYAVHRHQLTVLRRRLQGRVRLTNKDRRFLILLLPPVSVDTCSSLAGLLLQRERCCKAWKQWLRRFGTGRRGSST